MNLLLDTRALLWWLDHAHVVADLPPIHRDPFDRMLVAQSAGEGFTIVTRDPVIPGYGIPTLQA